MLFFRRNGILDGCRRYVSALSFSEASLSINISDRWYNLFIARLGLGLAVGAKSSTTPVYSAESTPKTIRGALTMMWQMWTGIDVTATSKTGVD